MNKCDVIEVLLPSQTVRVLARSKSTESAIAIEKMVIARRGVTDWFFVVVDAGKYNDGDRWPKP